MLRHVSSNVNESSSIAILDGDDILYIARAFTSRIMTVDLDIGSRLPATCTSMGRAMLSRLPAAELAQLLDRARLVQHTPHTIVERPELEAELARVAEQGYALIDQELEIGLRSIAVPIIGGDGRAAAAINVGVQAARVSREDLLLRILPVLREAAAELALLLA